VRRTRDLKDNIYWATTKTKTLFEEEIKRFENSRTPGKRYRKKEPSKKEGCRHKSTNIVLYFIERSKTP